MEKCENCNCEHNGTYGSGRFCSSKCARGYSTKEKRNEINVRVSEKLKGRYNKKRFLTEDELKQLKNKLRKTWDEKLFNSDFNSLGLDSKRRRVILEQDCKCNNCGNDKWLGYDIMLEIEHKDGNHSNNNRENLEMLCPNCHSLTTTWRGRNKRDKKHKISDEKLLDSLVENDFNMRQALLSVGLAAKGGNYGRCHKLKREYDEII